MGEARAEFEELSRFVTDAYIPFAEVERVIPWPGNNEGRLENDAEHSFSLAFIAPILGERIGLDPGKLALYATYHDFVERYAGDTSVWDTEGLKDKQTREEKALERIKQEYPEFVWQIIEDYEQRADEEARFVYALDKIIPWIIIAHDGGRFWKENGITLEKFIKQHNEVTSKKVALHPVVAKWHKELVEMAISRADELLA